MASEREGPTIYRTCPDCLKRNEGGFAFPQHTLPCPEHGTPALDVLLRDPGTVLPGEMALFEKVYEWTMRDA